jgi:hypothetical protein
MKLGSNSFLATLCSAAILPLARGHGTEVRICTTPSGKQRFFVKHWHGSLGTANSAGTMTIKFEDQVTGTTSQSTKYPNGLFNNKPLTGSSTGWGCLNDAEPTRVGTTSCGTEDDWVYFDSAAGVCNSPVRYTLLAGNTAILESGCGSLYPAATAWFTITDQSPPIPKVNGNTLPWNLVLSASNAGDSSAVATFLASADDDCDPSPSIVLSHASGSSFPIGDTVVTVNATDVTGRSTVSQLTVTVIAAPSSSPSKGPTVSPSNTVSYCTLNTLCV